MTKLYLENILNVYLETSLKLHLELLSAAAQLGMGSSGVTENGH